MIQKVHVVCKTHLDIGFTDFSASVLRHYLDRFLPAALDLAKLANADRTRPPAFVWTTGSYLIDLALRTLDASVADRLDTALRLGDIAYHALPFTMHSELCGPELFEAGLGIARRLDKRYGRRTIAAKMTDVPGHTSGIIGPLHKSGVKFLHIGINAVAAMPRVPPLFMWENAAGERVMVHYARGYGGVTRVDGHDEALVFLHASDNAGPPSADFHRAAMDRLRSEFPEASVFGSTLDTFAEGLFPLADSLPVVRDEIGDTWIHGVGTDPAKTSALRSLERLCAAHDRTGAWRQDDPLLPDGRTRREAFLEQLLLVCEHTWGLDMKKFLTDFKNWNREPFDLARKQDWIRDDAALGVGYDSCFAFAREEYKKQAPQGITWADRSYSLFESSHREQREYLKQAVETLGPLLKPSARQLLSDTPRRPACPAREGHAHEAVLGHYTLRLKQDAIHFFAAGKPLMVMALPLYQEVGLLAYERLADKYLVHLQQNRDWAVPDYLKPGAEHSDAPREDRMHSPLPGGLSPVDAGLMLEGSYPEAPQRSAGCPRSFSLLFRLEGDRLAVDLWLSGKRANRKPEALFLPIFVPGRGSTRLLKVGEWVKPERCVPGGNRRVHAVQDTCVIRKGRALWITPLDSPLVCLAAPRLLDFDGEADNGLIYFCLYNNLWGTNFKLWYEEEILCRFLITPGVYFP